MSKRLAIYSLPVFCAVLLPVAAEQREPGLAESDRLLERAEALSSDGKYREALPLAEQAAGLRSTALGEANLEFAGALNTLGEIQGRLRDLEHARRSLERALAIRERHLGPDAPEVGESLTRLGSVLDDLGQSEQARNMLNRAIAIEEKRLGPYSEELAVTLNVLAFSFSAAREFAQAKTLWERCLAIREHHSEGNQAGLALVLNNLGSLARDTGALARAEEYYQRSLQIYRNSANHPRLVLTLLNLGSVALDRGAWERAGQFLEEGLALSRGSAGLLDPQTAAFLYNLGVLRAYRNELSLSEGLLLQALAIQAKLLGTADPALAATLRMLGLVYATGRQYARAEPYYQAAIDIAERAWGAAHPEVVRYRHDLGILYHLQGRPREARAILAMAVRLHRQALPEETPDFANTLNSFAVTLCAQGDTSDGLNRMAESVQFHERAASAMLASGSEEQKQAYLDTLRIKLDQAVSVHARLNPQNRQALHLAFETVLRLKGRVLESFSGELAALRRSGKPGDSELLAEWAKVRERRASLALSHRNQKPDTYNVELASVLEEQDRIEASIGMHSGNENRGPGPLSLESVRAAIPSDSALVELVAYTAFDFRRLEPGERYFAAYILRPGSEPEFVDLGKADRIEAAANQLRKAFGDPGDSGAALIARQMDELVMRPIRPYLGSARRVLLSPDAGLNLVPFAALRDASGRYRIEQYTFSYLATGRDLLRPRAAAASGSGPLLIGNPDFGDTRSAGSGTLIGSTAKPLPATADEVRAIGRLLGNPRTLEGAEATKSALKTVNGPALLHIATHGFFLEGPGTRVSGTRALVLEGGAGAAVRQDNGNPLLRTGLVLAGANQPSPSDNGILTAIEAATLNLAGTRLVVLSACETGLGDAHAGEGVYGLRRAFSIAGARAQVISLWKVDDAATSGLMTAFYGRLMAGATVTEALRAAQILAIKRHPFYWGAFIPSGDAGGW
jgi:CHAT domain-containing protein/tetratricopeptide (TPR) repeat protein